MRQTKPLGLCAVLLIALCAGCKQDEKPPSSQVTAPPAAAQSAPPAAPAPVIPPASVLASAQFSADPNLRCDLLEVKRVSGGALLIRWRMTQTADAQAGGLAASEQKGSYYDFSWGELYYTDPAENKKYGFLTDSDGNRILEMFHGTYKAGDQRINWAKFPAPPPGSTKITVYIPKFQPFEDVPVS